MNLPSLLAPVAPSRLLASLLASLLAATACVSRPQMCVASSECAVRQACVAGHCQDPSGTALIQKKDVRREVVDPVAIAYVQRGVGATDGALPPVFTLGASGGASGDARLYLRFAVPLSKELNILEAYVLLDRSSSAQPDPSPIILHAARVLDPWDPRSISWALQPRFEDLRTPATRVAPLARQVVRVDVREIVRRWHMRDTHDQGLVIMADHSTDVGMAFAMTPSSPGADAPERDVTMLPATSASPRLELYMRSEATH